MMKQKTSLRSLSAACLLLTAQLLTATIHGNNPQERENIPLDSIRSSQENGKQREGVAILKRNTPTHSHTLYYTDLKWLKTPEWKNGRVFLRMDQKKSREQGQGYSLSFNASVGIETHDKLPGIQQEYAQGSPINGRAQWRGPETGEYFAWGACLALARIRRKWIRLRQKRATSLCRQWQRNTSQGIPTG